MLRFDAYTATSSSIDLGHALQLVMDTVGDAVAERGRGPGFQRFGERFWFKDAAGSQFASVQTGGAHGDLVMLEAKGEHTPELAEAIRGAGAHRCTRVDSCADFDEPGVFERLDRRCREIKRRRRVMGGKAGDWDDFPEKGRTRYLGGTSSAVRARLYEKGRQPEYAHLAMPDWVRLEVQVRPSKDARAEFAKLSPVEVWGAARWTRDIAAALLHEHVEPHAAGTVYRLSERERALRWMCEQYGPHLVGLLEDVGDWQAVGLTLGEMVHEAEERKRNRS